MISLQGKRLKLIFETKSPEKNSLLKVQPCTFAEKSPIYSALSSISRENINGSRNAYFKKKSYFIGTVFFASLNLQCDQKSAHFLSRFDDFLIFDASLFKITFVSHPMLFEKKNINFGKTKISFVHIIFKLCFILSWHRRPMKIDSKYLETWPWFKCTPLNCTI